MSDSILPSPAEVANQLSEKISSLLLSEGSGTIGPELQRNIRALLQSGLSNLDVVSREEFDAQVAVLQRSREKIDQLEAMLAELSSKLDTE